MGFAVGFTEGCGVGLLDDNGVGLLVGLSVAVMSISGLGCSNMIGKNSEFSVRDEESSKMTAFQTIDNTRVSDIVYVSIETNT